MFSHQNLKGIVETKIQKHSQESIGTA